MEKQRQKRQENERVPNDDPPRPIEDPPVGDDESEPTEPEGDPKPDVSPIKVRSNRAHSGGESIIEHARRTCRMCGRVFRHETELVDHEITLHPQCGAAQDRSRSRDEQLSRVVVRRMNASKAPPSRSRSSF